MALDLERLRAETPGIAHRIHFNNAGAALMPTPVIEAVKTYVDLEAAIGGYEAAAQETARLDDVYVSVARLIGARPTEIALMENATAAWDMAFYALPQGPGDRVLTAEAEYAANYVAYLQVARRRGIVVEIIPSDDDGVLDPVALEQMIDERVKLIAITWLPTNGGLINPAADVGQIARAHGIPYLLDTCQAVGQMPVDVDAIGCDMLSATGRKFLRGPRGTGFLYVRQSFLARLEPPMIDHFAAPWTDPDTYRLREDARRFETWESAYALHLGLGVAVDYALAIGLDAIEDRCQGLAGSLRRRLAVIPGVVLHDLGRQKSAIVTFTLDGQESEAVKSALGEQRINVSVSRPASTFLDAQARSLPPMVRASPHYYNDENEISEMVAAVRALA